MKKILVTPEGTFEIELTAEEIVAMAISYFKNQLESGETQFVEGGQQAPSK